MRTDVFPPPRSGFKRPVFAVLVIFGLIVFLMGGPFRTVPAGHVGVKDFFGSVSNTTVSVSRPVCTVLPVLGQRVRISGIQTPCEPYR